MRQLIHLGQTRRRIMAKHTTQCTAALPGRSPPPNEWAGPPSTCNASQGARRTFATTKQARGQMAHCRTKEGHMADSNLDAIIRMPEVIKITALSESTIRRGMRAGTFPKSLRLGARAIGWQKSAIRAWLAGPDFSEGLPGDQPSDSSS
ncbi:helix-turn-helix transcriptional regulator [Xanthomonas oryzae pv. oryzicola]|uniref:helix-turn-helix transcriptional regulator n=2 Tax=Xanthomonas oryzae TaxID=347 RepID=UPI003CCFE3E6